MARIRLIAVLAALALIASACGAARSADTSTTSTTVGRTATTTPGATTTARPASPEIQDRIDELIIEAQQLRGLEFLEPVDVVLLTTEEYQARFAEIVEEDLAEEDVQATNALLRVLGIIGPQDDFRELVETLYSAGTGGFYDPETEELVVRLIGGDFGPYAESVVVHELVHALQDQHFELSDERPDLDGDAYYVATAIIEGDALLREAAFVQAMSLAEQASYIGDISSIDLSALDTLPGYIVNSFQSAYLDGFTFHQRIGLDEIDGQFLDPPESSEQLLDADSYRSDEQPKEVTLPDYEIPGYEVWFDAPAGQKDLELLLADGVSITDAINAAQGWGGDWNRVYNAGEDEAAYILKYLGDSKADAEQLAEAFTEYIATMVPSEAYTLVDRQDDAVLVIIASDPALGPELKAAFS